MNKQKTVKWGMIGAGNVTEKKSGPAFSKVKHSELVAVMRRTASKAADYAYRHKVKKWYSNAEELINDPEVNAIYIATPPNSHASYAIQAMRAKKPVYIEKPMARNFSECKEILKISEETGIPVWVAYYRRTLPAFLKVKEILNSGIVGKPLLVNVKLYKQARENGLQPDQMSWHVFPKISGGGYFFDLASHQLDYLDFLFGPITAVKGIAVNNAKLYPAEDTVTGTWKHKTGVIGAGTWCFVANKNAQTDEINILAEKGNIILPCFNHGKIKINISGKTKEMKFCNPEHISQNLIEQVVNEIRGIKKCVSTGQSAARTSWVLDEIVKNYYKGK